jgi:hypothetical protein
MAIAIVGERMDLKRSGRGSLSARVRPGRRENRSPGPAIKLIESGVSARSRRRSGDVAASEESTLIRRQRRDRPRRGDRLARRRTPPESARGDERLDGAYSTIGPTSSDIAETELLEVTVRDVRAPHWQRSVQRRRVAADPLAWPLT